ncbi:RES domain-containing protein [Microbacterium yannicii]|uniref:RES domain-containing protein n=1 Tax=Microbacterium yannicii TaxID=671622 RepID=UPI00031530DA|nr:RES domain-containing protein [Microbacterium yannicii]
MTPLQLPVSGDPGPVWRVGYAPDPWQWTPWEYAKDRGRFNGRWDDQNADFRTLYTGDSLLGCFLELLASQRPNDLAYAELAAIEDDDHAAKDYPDPERGAIGLDWLNDRLYARGLQIGTYAEVTHAEALAFLVDAGVFDRLGIPPHDVDASLLKDPRQRDITRTVARFLFDLRDKTALQPLVDGIAFRSRMGDDIRLWAVFQRSENDVSELITPDGPPHPVTDDNPDLARAFTLLGLHWKATG